MALSLVLAAGVTLIGAPALAPRPPLVDNVQVAPPTGRPETDRHHVQAAFDRVQPGDTVMFAPGMYVTGEDEAAVLAVVDAALERVSAEDMPGLTDLMLPGAAIGAVGSREGRPFHRMRSRDEERAASLPGDVVERGFAAEVMLSGPLAMAWVPYDLYIDGAWSHCGVDVFTLFRTVEGWRIASLTYSVEQPPACRRHPDGPPGAG